MKKLVKILAILMATSVIFTMCKKDETASRSNEELNHNHDFSLEDAINQPLNFEGAKDLGEYLLVEGCYLIPKSKIAIVSKETKIISRQGPK